MGSEYIADTSDYVISNVDMVSDEILTKDENKEKPEFLSGHSNLGLIWAVKVI